MANAFHVSLNVRSIPEAVERYRRILGADPAKVHADYAKFELADPPLVLSLNLGGEPGTVGHLGIRRPDAGAVAAELRKAQEGGLEPFSQEGVTCCYAKADKFWVRDSDGLAWEMYAFLADADTHSTPDPAPAPPAARSGCCAA